MCKQNSIKYLCKQVCSQVWYTVWLTAPNKEYDDSLELGAGDKKYDNDDSKNG